MTPGPITAAGWVVYALLMVLLAAQVFLPVMPQDEGQLLAYPWFMAHGLVLYRDIWNMYPPGTYVILACLMKVGVPGLVAERGLSVAVHALYPLLINRAAAGSWRRFSWLAVIPAFTFLFLIAYPDIRAYPWSLGLAVFMAGVILARSRPRSAGLVFLTATAFRLELVAPALGLLVIMALLDPGRRRCFVESSAMLVAGTGLLLGLLTVATSGAAFYQLVIDAFIRIPPGRSLPFRPFSISIFVLPLGALTIGSPAVLAVAGLIKRRPYVVATNVSVAALIPHFLQRAETDYLYAVSAAVIPWLVISLILLTHDTDKFAHTVVARRMRIVPTVFLAVVATATSGLSLILLVLYAMLFSPLSPGTRAAAATTGSRVVTNGANMIIAATDVVARNDSDVLRYLRAHSASKEGLYISPIGLRYAMSNMTSMYFLLKMRPGTRYLEMNPGVETRRSVQREIVRNLRGTAWVLLWKGGFWHEDNASQRPGSALLARYIPQHYRIVLNDRTYELLERQPA